MADVQLDLDADHAAVIGRAIDTVITGDFPETYGPEDRAVLTAVRDVIDRQLAPEATP